ncbi:VOC family protein [Aureibaculum sp. A20]|uniref:VOC family protein n=1 Tax=Aureibaculum flavum TaxID=2795986 RepID=A0ABS0WRV8_9FLAO|nr:VOC family protein [Aureibaculum flavum]MBJ2174722.1 VOC family protein [Aureibaculum flavum]
MQIKELTIYSSNIKAQADFYTRVLGVTCIISTDQKVSFQLGTSILTIAYKPKATPYHFAINIPANKEVEVLAWLKTKVAIEKEGSNEIIDFTAWNAKAIYFYDQDHNIVELIARKNLNNSTPQPFDASQFLEISEIGMPTTTIEKIYTQLHKLTNIKIYDGSFDRFCAIGDEHGLFICINPKVKDWFPTQDKAFASAFEIMVVEQGKEYCMKYENEALNLLR